MYIAPFCFFYNNLVILNLQAQLYLFIMFSTYQASMNFFNERVIKMRQSESLLRVAIEIYTDKKVSSLNTKLYGPKHILSSESCEKWQLNHMLIIDPPSVKTLSKKDILEGRYLSVPCETTPGNPNSTTIYWTKVGEPEFRQSGATLQLANINRTSSGTYRCTAENNYINKEKGTDSQSMVINVQCKLILSFLYIERKCFIYFHYHQKPTVSFTFSKQGL